MQNYQKQTIGLIQQAQQRQLEVEEIYFVNKLEELPISDLRKPFYNKRVIVESRLKQLIYSLEDFGFLGGIYVHNNSLNVIEGWHRCELWQALGHKTIPCYKIDCNSTQEVELHLKLNQQTAVFNLTEFGLEFEGLNLIEDFGFSEADLLPTLNHHQSAKTTALRNDPEGYTKLSTLVKYSTLEKLKEVQSDRKLPTIGDVVETLIELI
jgi:hypothetical protein